MAFVQAAGGVIAFGDVKQNGTAPSPGVIQQALEDLGGQAVASRCRLDPHPPRERISRRIRQIQPAHGDRSVIDQGDDNRAGTSGTIPSDGWGKRNGLDECGPEGIWRVR